MKTLSHLFSRVAHKLHPKLGRLYDGHERFFNDSFVELVGLGIANLFIIWLSYYFIGLILSIVLLFTATPLTWIMKYFLHKYWVWKQE